MVKILLQQADYRTRQSAVFLCLIQADMISQFSGGAIGPNTTPPGNTPSRLVAVVEPRHLNLAVTKQQGE
jgi:hypothetical protein